MSLKTPLKAIQRNLLVTKQGEIWAYYRITPKSIHSGNKTAKEEQKEAFQHFVEQLERYQDFHLHLFPKQMELEKLNAELEKDFDESTRKIGQYYNRETERLLKSQLGLITKNEFIFGAKLKDNIFDADDTKTKVVNAVGSVTDTLLNLFNLSREITDEFYEKFEEIEKELYQLVVSIGGRRLREDELVYFNRHAFIRDMQHAIEEESGNRGVSNITDGVIDPTHTGYLKLETPEGERWMTHVVVDDFGYDMNYTHIFERAQNFSFPTEFAIKAQFKDPDSVLRKTGMVKTRMKQMAGEKRETGDEVEDSVKDARYVLNRLENQLRGSNQKFIEWVATFVVTGATKKECKKRASQVRRSMNKKEIDCVQPSADQLQLFYKFLPGQSLMFEKNWVQKTTCVGFAENLFGVSQRLGNNIGFYLGRINRYLQNNSIQESVHSSRDIVLFHPFVANKGIEGAMTDSPHISVTGETGKGKSFLIKMIVMFLAMLKVKTLYIDPKTEVQEQFERTANDPEIKKKYPLFSKLLKSFEYYNLNANDPNSHGVLDPIVMLEGVEAKDTAQAVIEQIYTLDNKDDVKRVLLRAIDEVLEERQRGEEVGFMQVIERLQASEELAVKNAGELLYQEIHNSVLQLIFSNGKVKSLNFTSKMNILGIEGLDLPDKDTKSKDYESGEKKALAIMIPLSKFCNKFGMENKKQETCVIFDEGWMLTSARSGKKLIKSMRRVGRSYNNALVLVTQSVKDVNTEDDNGNFGVNFAFDEKSERKDILRFMDLEVDEEEKNANEKLLANMIKGECLMRDIYGDTNKIAIHCLFEEWAEAFKTVENTHSALAEKKFA